MTHAELHQLSYALHRFSVHYARNNCERPLPSLINYGHCFVWAYIFHNFLRKYNIDSKLVSCTNLGGHAWVEVDGVAYDSEHTDGCSREQLVKDFSGMPFAAAFIEEMDEWKFYIHWSQYGHHGDLLADETFMQVWSGKFKNFIRRYKNKQKAA